MWLYNIVLKLNPFQSKNGKVIDIIAGEQENPGLIYVYCMYTL